MEFEIWHADWPIKSVKFKAIKGNHLKNGTNQVKIPSPSSEIKHSLTFLRKHKINEIERCGLTELTLISKHHTHQRIKMYRVASKLVKMRGNATRRIR